MIFSCVGCQEELSPTGSPFVAIRCKHLYCIDCTLNLVEHQLACPFRCFEDAVSPADVQATDMIITTTSPEATADVLSAHTEATTNVRSSLHSVVTDKIKDRNALDKQLVNQSDSVTRFSRSVSVRLGRQTRVLNSFRSQHARLKRNLQVEHDLDKELKCARIRLRALRRARASSNSPNVPSRRSSTSASAASASTSSTSSVASTSSASSTSSAVAMLPSSIGESPSPSPSTSIHSAASERKRRRSHDDNGHHDDGHSRPSKRPASR